MIDIGVNLTDKQFDRDREDVIQRALEAGVHTLVLTGTDLEESIQAAALAEQFPDCCYSTAGFHPHGAKHVDEGCIKELCRLFAQEKVVAAGEMGLDFNRDFSPRPVQEQVFEQQLELAVQYQLPAFCHERDAAGRFFDIAQQYRDNLSGMVVHCFTADKKALYRYLDLDLHIGITGWVCDERRGTHLHPLLKDIPANRLMIETDAPWLLPRTIEKKPKNRRNEPAFLPWIVQTVAEHTGKSAERVMQETTATAAEFFKLPVVTG